MIKVKNLILNSTPQIINFDRVIDKPSTMSIQNISDSATIFIGTEDVTSSSYGVRLLPGQLFSADLGAYDYLYAVGSGPASVLVIDR